MTQSLSEPQENAQPKEVRVKRLNLRLLLPVVVLVGAGLTAWYLLSRPQTNDLELSGRLEGYETDLGTKVQGRVESVSVREGDEVRKGELVVQLDDAEIQAQLAGATARLKAVQQEARNADLEIDVLASQVKETQLIRRQDRGEAQGRISQADANVAVIEAQLAEAQAQATQTRSELQLARADRDRFAQLVQQGAVTQQRFDQAQTNFETTQATLRSREAAVEAARKQITAAQGELVQAQSTDLNPAIRNAQIDTLNKQLAQARAQLAGAQAEVASAAAARQEILAQVDDLTILSPIDGVVITRNVEPGEVLASGTTVLSVLDLNAVYLRGYIPEGEIGRVRVGQLARVYLDSAPDKALSARVEAIDSEASFTPENVYFREDRVTQVFGVKLTITNPAGFAKPGMPADAEIVMEGDDE